jgi:isoleucyl-tRNA synthetase
VTVILADPSRKAAVAELSGLLTDELNVHRVVFATDASKFVAFQVKPDFKKLGARLGKDMKAVAAALGTMDPLAVKRALDQGGLDVAIDGRTVRLGPDDVVVAIQPKGEFQAASSAAGVVVVSTVIDAALQAEGFVRELVNRVQNLRKELDLGYTQRIALTIQADADATAAIRANAAYLQRETLTRELSFAALSNGRTVEVDGRALEVQVSPL